MLRSYRSPAINNRFDVPFRCRRSKLRRPGPCSPPLALPVGRARTSDETFMLAESSSRRRYGTVLWENRSTPADRIRTLELRPLRLDVEALLKSFLKAAVIGEIRPANGITPSPRIYDFFHEVFMSEARDTGSLSATKVGDSSGLVVRVGHVSEIGDWGTDSLQVGS